MLNDTYEQLDRRLNEKIYQLEMDKRKLFQRLLEIRNSSRGTIINEDGDPMYALIPLRVLNDQ